MLSLLVALHLIADGFPLVADHLVTGPHAHVTVTNTAAQSVTAWALAVVTHPAPGRTHREIETIDGYLSAATHGIAGAPERLEQLAAGQSREIALDPLPEDAVVEVAAVVLDDGTAIGDEAIVKPIFDRRARERDALGSVAAAFNDVLASQHGTAALDALRARLDALPDRDAVPCRAAIEAVETYRQRAANRSPDQIDESLRTYAAFVAREWALAKKAAARKS